VAILLQGIWAIVIALSGSYGQVINYVVAMDSLFFGLTAVCLFVLRQRNTSTTFRMPGHPWTTLFFIAAQWLVVVSTFANDPRRAFLGLGFALLGLPIYSVWRKQGNKS
jgi:APA family basic amino acid/polyamine antiporter